MANTTVKTAMRSSRDIGGSKIVIWRNREHYIDVKNDVRPDRIPVAECVRNGRVYRRTGVTKPEQVIKLIKEELL